MTTPIRPGLWIYCDSHDVIHVTETVATLKRSGAVGAIAMIEGITPGGSQRLPLDRLKRFVDACALIGVTVWLCAFPDIRGDLIKSRDWLAAACELLGCRGQLDAEPRQGSHWSAALLAPWLSIPELTITTTRIEAPRLGSHGRLVLAQLEQQTSVDTLSSALSIFGRTSAPESIVLVTGSFDQAETQGGRRTLEEVRADLERCTPHAKLARAHAVWSAHTLDKPEADALREWALETF